MEIKKKFMSKDSWKRVIKRKYIISTSIANMANPYFLISLIAIFSYLMISEIPFFSLKIKNLRFKENINIYILAIVAVVAFIVLGFAAIPFVMLFYMVEALLVRS